MNIYRWRIESWWSMVDGLDRLGGWLDG